MTARDGSDGSGSSRRGGAWGGGDALATQMPAALALPAPGHLRERERPFLHAPWRERLGLDAAGGGTVTRVFLYGTLMHPPHLSAVLGHEAGTAPARLDGWRRGRAGADPWPALTPEPGAAVEGVVLEASAQDLARLDRYERAHGHAPLRVMTSEGKARVYLPEGGAAPKGEWSLDDWAAEWGALAAEVAREAMAEEGDLAPRMPSIRRRAMARLAARSEGPDRSGDVEVLSRRRPYSAFFALEEYELRHRRFDGGWSLPVQRAVLLGFDAVIALPYDPARDRVLLIEQIRMGLLARGAPNPWSMEPVAGLLDPGETPQDCARREAREEAGLELGALHPVAQGYASPGNATGFHHHFVGICDLPNGAAGFGGLASEHEDIRGHLLPADDLIAGAQDGRFDNAPLILCALWLALHRDRLRAGA